MSGYEIEHGTADPSSNEGSQESGTWRAPRRPDLSTFFTTLNEVTPDPDHPQHRPHAVPVPSDVSAVFGALVEALDSMRQNVRDAAGDEEGASDELLNRMIANLMEGVQTPPREVEGVSEEFCDMLERVPKASLTEDQICPICNNPFLEDEYPLVVRLPCHPTHLFDLECVKPWLRLQGTCPLDRFDFAEEQRKKKEEQERIAAEDDEEEWDGLYA